VTGVYCLLRTSLGLALTAIRDDEVGASGVGVRVLATRRVAYLLAAVGAAAAGGLLAVSQLHVEPTSVFSVQWSAAMIFVCVIGGIGTVEGPILGTIVYFGLQQTLAQYGPGISSCSAWSPSRSRCWPRAVSPGCSTTASACGCSRSPTASCDQCCDQCAAG
jgi:ABC-type branched-subunit amino acid transport system permease subunit